MKTLSIPPEQAESIEQSLRAGAKAHAFRSGGGLRVIRVEKQGVLVGYGEHPNVEEAFAMLAKDLSDGQVIYNPTRPEPHYLTGSSTPSSDVDLWLLGGATFDAYASEDTIVVELVGYQELRTPEVIVARAQAGETVPWSDDRGVELLTSPCWLPNGEIGCSTKVEHVPEGLAEGDVWMWESLRRGSGATLMEAFASAFVARHELI